MVLGQICGHAQMSTCPGPFVRPTRPASRRAPQSLLRRCARCVLGRRGGGACGAAACIRSCEDEERKNNNDGGKKIQEEFEGGRSGQARRRRAEGWGRCWKGQGSARTPPAGACARAAARSADGSAPRQQIHCKCLCFPPGLRLVLTRVSWPHGRRLLLLWAPIFHLMFCAGYQPLACRRRA